MRWSIALALAALTGCTSSVFNKPVVLSTKTDAVHVVRRIKPISAEQCDTVIVIVPIAHDPGDMFDELLARSREAGGNAVLDLQVRDTSVAMAFPLFVRSCAVGTGTAAVID